MSDGYPMMNQAGSAAASHANQYASTNLVEQGQQTIVGVRLIKKDVVDNIQTFDFEVSTQSGMMFGVRRSSTELHALFTWINSTFPDLNSAFPALPSKIQLRTWSWTVLQAKYDELASVFASKITSFPDVLNSWEMQQFLASHVQLNAQASSSSHLEGMLFLRVHSASGLAPYRGQAFVRVAVSSAGQNFNAALETDKVANSSDPKFFKEMTFSVRNRQAPVRIQVWSKYLLSPSVLLGQAQLNMIMLQDFAFQTIDLDLKDGAKVKVSAQFTPMKIADESNLVLPDMRILLARDYFVPGETFAGQLVANIRTPIYANEVKLVLKGMMKVNVYEAMHSMQGSYQRFHTANTKTLDLRATCWKAGANGNGRQLMPGTHVWNFKFTFPSNCIPTVSASHHRESVVVTYSLGAKILRPALASDYKLKIPLSIHSPYVSQSPGVLVAGTDKPAYTSPSGNVNMRVSVEGNVAKLGGKATTVFISIQNLTRAHVVGVQLSLSTSFNFSSYISSPASIQKWDQLVSSSTGFPIPPGQSKDISLTVVLPPTINPTLDRVISPHVGVSYLFRVGARLGAPLSGEAVINMPVLVSHAAMPSMSIVVPYYAQTQPSRAAIESYGAGLPCGQLHEAVSFVEGAGATAAYVPPQPAASVRGTYPPPMGGSAPPPATVSFRPPAQAYTPPPSQNYAPAQAQAYPPAPTQPYPTQPYPTQPYPPAPMAFAPPPGSHPGSPQPGSAPPMAYGSPQGMPSHQGATSGDGAGDAPPPSYDDVVRNF